MLIPTATKSDYGRVVFCTKLILWLYWYVAPYACVIAVVFGLDPLYLVTRLVPSTRIVILALFLFRGAFMFKIVNEMLMTVFIFLMAGVMILCSMLEFIQSLGRKTDYKRLDLEVVRFYKELQTWNGFMNSNFFILLYHHLFVLES